MWKDYYLDHTPRINDLVTRKRKSLVVKKPSLDTFSRIDATFDVRHESSATPTHTSLSDTGEGGKGARRTSASISHPPPKPKSHGKAKEAGKNLGRPAERSPTPPANPVPSSRGRGFAFTEDDKKYIIKYARYRLQQDPSMSRSDICAEIAEKVCRSIT